MSLKLQHTDMAKDLAVLSLCCVTWLCAQIAMGYNADQQIEALELKAESNACASLLLGHWNSIGLQVWMLSLKRSNFTKPNSFCFHYALFYPGWPQFVMLISSWTSSSTLSSMSEPSRRFWCSQATRRIAPLQLCKEKRLNMYDSMMLVSMNMCTDAT